MSGKRWAEFAMVMGALFLGIVGYARVVTWIWGDSTTVILVACVPLVVWLVWFVNEMVDRKWPF